ncbi:MAG: hemolysin D [Thiotrichaceae bacterium]|nr:MAG: hemolysin D [Thiotrichaceae bacterium]
MGDSVNFEGENEYSLVEERLNISSHAIGLLFSVIALILLVIRASEIGDLMYFISFSVFGISLIVLYAASTFYHSVQAPVLRNRMRIVDHAAIYILIAGTYTPFTLVVLGGWTGWIIFAVSWTMATIGIVLKLFFTGKYDRISTFMYVFMGWIILFAIQPLIETLPYEGLFWLVAGGVSYTMGAILYSIERIKFNHAIFHIFVLLGSVCHFVSVYFYVWPVN